MILGIHSAHHVEPREHKQRPNNASALTNAVARATSKSRPVHFTEIVNEVRDDYGTVSERTVYRHVRKLVERGNLVKLDLGLSFAAYIRPKSRLLRDLESLRDYMLGICEIHPVTKKEPRRLFDERVPA